MPHFPQFSAPASSRSYTAGDAGPSEVDLIRRRSRLRQSGTLVSSRSIVSRADGHHDFEVVDVGEGHRANRVEHLLARLEQHGLRRRLVAEDDASSYAVDIAARSEEEISATASNEFGCTENLSTSATRHAGSSSFGSSAGSSDETDLEANVREAHYYICVPCEVRLTHICLKAPSWRVLQDVHFHFSSASHRATATWMADDDIDETLHSTPLVTPTDYYSRIYVNGIPMLLSRRPGGGDMFFPLPHEQTLVTAADAAAAAAQEREWEEGWRDSMGASAAPKTSATPMFSLFPRHGVKGSVGGAPVLWHLPLTTLYSGKVQMFYQDRRVDAWSPTESNRSCLKPPRIAKKKIKVHHIDLEVYRAHSCVPPRYMLLKPMLYRLSRERIPKVFLSSSARLQSSAPSKTAQKRVNALSAGGACAADAPHRIVYTQPFLPLLEGSSGAGAQTTSVAEAAAEPVTVFEDECYRIALCSEEDGARHAERQLWNMSEGQQQPSSDAAGSATQESTAPVLTLELLMQHTQSTSESWRQGVHSTRIISTVATSQQAPLSNRSDFSDVSLSSEVSSDESVASSVEGNSLKRARHR